MNFDYITRGEPNQIPLIVYNNLRVSQSAKINFFWYIFCIFKAFPDVQWLPCYMNVNNPRGTTKSPIAKYTLQAWFE